MSVHSIKRQLTSCHGVLTSSKYSARTLSIELLGTTPSNVLSVIPAINSVYNSVSRQDAQLRQLHRDCSAELHLYFREFNNQTRQVLEMNQSIMKFCKNLVKVCQQIYEMYMFEQSLPEWAEGLIDVDCDALYDASDIFFKLGTLYDMESQNCLRANRMLIVKRRGK